MTDDVRPVKRPRADRRTGGTAGPFTPRADPRVSDAPADAAALRRRAASVNRGAARAAVLGVNDGLVTNVCLILGLVGASASADAVRLAGLASLIAGAFSMAAGEWISVQSQLELFDGVVGELRRLTARNPRLVLDELARSLGEQGLADDTAHRVAAELPLDEEHFIDFSSRNLFGVDPGELGSPWVAAGSSMVLFSAGASVPLTPWLITDGSTAVAVSVLATAVASAIVGGWVARSADRPPMAGALRQLGIVIAASAVTYGIGELFDTVVA